MLSVQLIRALKNQRGNALLMVMGVAAFIAAVTVAIYRRSDLTNSRGHQAEFRDDTQSIMSDLANLIQNPESCTNMLAGQTLQPGAGSNVSLNVTIDPNFPGPLTKGKAIQTGMTFGSLSVDDDTAVPQDPASHADMTTQIKDASGNLQAYYRYPSRLHAVLQSEDGSVVAVNRIRTASGLDLGIPLYVWADATHKITSCFGVTSAGSFCNMVGGYYVADPTNPVDLALRCRQSIYTQIWIDGKFVNRGSCRYGGLVNDSSQCTDRFGSTYNSYLIQNHTNNQVTLPVGYQCMLCE